MINSQNLADERSRAWAPGARGAEATATASVRLRVRDGVAWLERGDWGRTVFRSDFERWAAYSGIELRSQTCGSREVVLDTDTKMTMFGLAWVGVRDSAASRSAL